MSSLYFPFDSLVQLADFEDSSRATTHSGGRRANRQAGTMMGMPRLDLIEDQVSHFSSPLSSIRLNED